MQTDRKILIESIKRLLRRGAMRNLRKIVNKTHAADLAVVFRMLTLAEQKKLFGLIDRVETKGVLLEDLDEETLMVLLRAMELQEVIDILASMPKDDAVDLIGRLPDELADEILEGMKKSGSEDVEDLLGYDDETAGGIMTPDFIALREDTTAAEAIESLQKEYQDVEMPFYLYVVDEYGKLVGVSSLRQLVVTPPENLLRDFMATDVISVRTQMDQEEVAKLVARYDFLAVPVVDDTNRLVGIVTVDDVIDIFREEATEDILKMAGAGDEFIETKSLLKSSRIRLPWLAASCVGGIFAFLIIGHFEGSLEKMAFLAAFIPVIMGMGGNIGTQSSTIVVRGLATGRIGLSDFRKVLGKEFATGIILGVFYGLLIALVAHFRYSMAAVAVSVGVAVLSSMSVAALVGSLVPMTFARFNVDPAVATGPFVTTAIDIISVFFYFQIATLLLGF
ncbi:MAG: magnesium transporter [Desulfobacterales bacterium]|jgi:magnesium transporter